MSANGTNGKNKQAEHADWGSNPRWAGITRPYSSADVERLRGTIQIEYTLARLGAERLWNLMHTEAYVPALGAITGNQAIEMVQAGLKAIYGSGWQVAADGNSAGDVYPDQSLYPCDSAPKLVARINRALQRADQIESAEGKQSGTYWFAPIVADAEAGFGGSLNAYELMKAMIEAGAAAVHFEDQLSSAKKCGHLGGKVIVPTREFIEKLTAARLAADVCGVPALRDPLPGRGDGAQRARVHGVRLPLRDLGPGPARPPRGRGWLAGALDRIARRRPSPVHRPRAVPAARAQGRGGHRAGRGRRHRRPRDPRPAVRRGRHGLRVHGRKHGLGGRREGGARVRAGGRAGRAAAGGHGVWRRPDAGGGARPHADGQD